MVKSVKYIGIDPGINGGIAGIDEDGNALFHYQMFKKKNDTDIVKLEAFLKTIPKGVIIITENLHALRMVRASATWGMSRQVALLDAAIALTGHDSRKVIPRVWQKRMWLGEPILTNKEGKKDTKGISLSAFKKIYPEYEKMTGLTKKTGRFYDGIIDAYLLALYGLRENI